MSERSIVKNFNNFRGRDIRSSDLIRDFDYAIEFENARVVKEDSCVTRHGFKPRTKVRSLLSLHTYRYIDTTNGQTIEEMIALDSSLYRRASGGLTIAYSGSSTNVQVDTFLDTTNSVFVLTLTVDNVVVLTLSLGAGFETQANPIVTDLSIILSDINAISGFTATAITGTAQVPAAFLPITMEGDLGSAPHTITLPCYYWEARSTLSASVFSAYSSARYATEWQLASCVNINNCLFIGTGYEFLHKYDGQNVYRAGLPEATAIPTVTAGGSGYTDTNVKYLYLYKQIDNRGNIIYGVESDPSALVSPSDDTVSVTVTNILAASGFNTGCAKVNGGQSTVTTIAVDSGHTFKIGDTAYFLDGVSAGYVERAITATTSTTIVIAGAAVTVSDDAIISNNLRIVIYRTTAGGELYYKVAEIPNNSLTATQVYADALVIASLGTQYIPPTKIRDILAIKPRYLCTHQNLLIAAGAVTAANTWFFSNGEGPEYFDAEINFEQVKPSASGAITGCGSDQEHLIIGTVGSLFVVTGDLDQNNARQERISQIGVGFACHNSIVDVGGKLIFLSATGFYSVQNGFNVEEIGEQVNPEFINLEGLDSTLLPKLKRAHAIYFESTNEYICFVPTESAINGKTYPNANSVAHTYDTFHEAWGLWTGLNMGAGITIYGDNLWFLSRRYNTHFNAPLAELWERHNLGAVEDYSDHVEPIAFRLGTQWIDGGEPSVFKVFLWLKIYSLLRQIVPVRLSLTVRVERDFDLGVQWFQFLLALGGANTASGWGNFGWGNIQWGSPQTLSAKKKLKSGKARALRYVMLSSVLNQKIALSAWETVVTAPYSTDMKD